MIPDAPSCPECRIEVSEVVTLGDVDGPGILGGMPRAVTVDSLGRFWVLHHGGNVPIFTVFNEDGRPLRSVGRQGPGPAEFEFPITAVAAGDSVLLWDQRRLLVFGPDLEHARTVSLGELASYDQSSVPPQLSVVEWPNRVAVNTLFVGRPEAAGWPLHLLDVSDRVARLVTSFGSNDGVLSPLDAPEWIERAERGEPPLLDRRTILRQRLAVAPDGTIWAGHQFQYTLESWTPQGRSSGRQLIRAPEWFPERDDPRLWTFPESIPNS